MKARWGERKYDAEYKMCAVVVRVSHEMNSLQRVYGLDGTIFRRGRADPGSQHTIKGPFYYMSTLTCLRIDNWPMNTIQATNHWRRVDSKKF